MARPDQTRLRRFFVALLIGGALGAVIGKAITARTDGARTAPLSDAAPGEGASPAAESAIEDSIAWEYARAYQEGNWARVLELTLWVQERLQLVQATDGPDAVPAERDALMAAFGTRSIVDNHLLDTGVDDQYVFTPGATLTFDGVDGGRQDLEAPVARRTWLIVTYPAREKALLDGESIPIRSLRVGVNVSEDGYVLKANVIGNLDIDWASITYGWPSP